VDPGMLIYIAVTIIFWLRAPDAVVDVKNHVLRGTDPLETVSTPVVPCTLEWNMVNHWSSLQ
jgi:hypothetical protein